MRWPVLLCTLLVVLPSALFADRGPEITHTDATKLLSPGVKTKCTTTACMIESAYAADPKAQALALALFHDTGTIAGVGPEELMDGGYRGTIRLVPQLPLGKYRKHLTWTDDALRSIDTFFEQLFANQTMLAELSLARVCRCGFVRSIKKRTPSAYAFGWTIEYNVEGSLLTSAPGVLETLFHELFHNNDFDHGDWSAKTLQQDYDAIVEKCGTKAACSTPYAPNKTRVKATGTYYAFQPNNGNGVHEYAAEIAVRYFTEQRQMLRDGKLAKPAFKCGPPENARSWQALTTEFFAGRDLVPAC